MIDVGAAGAVSVGDRPDVSAVAVCIASSPPAGGAAALWSLILGFILRVMVPRIMSAKALHIAGGYAAVLAVASGPISMGSACSNLKGPR